MDELMEDTGDWTGVNGCVEHGAAGEPLAAGVEAIAMIVPYHHEESGHGR